MKQFQWLLPGPGFYWHNIQEIYQKLRQEVAQAVQGRLPTYKDLVNLPYCLQVFKETMRLYPPAAMTIREALRDVQIGDYFVPKGAMVLLPFYSMHRNPEYFPDPERFDPDRFAPEREKCIPRNAYLPFGSGAHICVGNHFAHAGSTPPDCDYLSTCQPGTPTRQTFNLMAVKVSLYGQATKSL